MNFVRLSVAGAAAAIALAACSQGAQGPPTISSVSPASPAYGTLQFSVGTANIFGLATGLSVVSTFRQVAGGTPAKSAVLVSTPSITGPFTLPGVAAAGSGYDPFATINAPSGGGPSAQEVAKGATISGTSQAVRYDEYVCDQVTPCSNSTAANTTSFGQSGGVFAMGLQPANTSNNGTPATYAPYTQPIWDVSTNLFVPWGGPPAYDPDGNGLGVRDGLNNLGGGVAGVNEGVTVFEGTAPQAGPYTLSLQVPTGQTNQNTPTFATLTKTASITGVATLPTLSPPPLVPDGAGGGTLAAIVPAGVTEEFVQVTDFGLGAGVQNCQGALGAVAFPVVYTIIVRPGATVATLPPAIGPNTSSGSVTGITGSPSICTAAQNTAVATAAANGVATPTQADQYSVQVFGTDYPLYEASPVFGGAAPAIAGTTGQSDITISAATPQFVYGSESAGPAPAPLNRLRLPRVLRRRSH